MDKKEETRARGWFIERSYDFETHDSDGQVINSISEDEWKKQVKEEWKSKVDDKGWLLMIFHDKDVLVAPDGTTSPKPLHAHGLIRFKNARTQSSVIKLMHLSRSGNCQPVHSYVDSARYLIHVSESALNARKHRYPDDAVIEVNKTIDEMMSRSTSNTGKKRLNDPEVQSYIDELSLSISESKVTLHQARLQLKRDFGNVKGHALWTRYADRFDKDLRLALSDKARLLKTGEVDRNLKTAYIYGAGGTGKSQLARAMARILSTDDGTFYAAAAPDRGKTFDFTGGYRGESVTVLDDCKASAFDLRAFFSIFDPYQYSLINSRNYDKDWLSNYAFLTCSDDYDTWVNDLMLFSTDGEKYVWGDKVDGHNSHIDWSLDVSKQDGWQVLRRTPIVIHVKKDTVGSTAYVYVLDDSMRAHLYLGSVSCLDVTKRQDIDTWAQDTLKLITVNQPVRRKPITRSFLCPTDYGIGSIKTAYCRKYIKDHSQTLCGLTLSNC